MVVFQGIAYFFWAVIGFVIWIPLMLRVVCAFCGTLIFNMVVNDPEYIQKGKQSLEFALRFYSSGFSTIQSTFSSRQLHSYSRTDEELKIKIGEFLLNILWTLFFWLSIIWAIVGRAIFRLFNRNE